MAIMAKLKTTDKERSGAREPVEQRLRRKLITRLQEQKELVEGELEGKHVVRTRTKFVHNAETGETTRQEVPKRTKRWFWKEPDGSVCLKLFYGASVVSLGDNSTIEIDTLDKLPGMIDTIVEAVSAGELDEPLKTASDERRSKFRRVKKARG